MQFYVFKSKEGLVFGTTEYYEYKPTDSNYAPKCETCGKYIGCIQWLPPFRVELKTIERHFDDVAWGPGDIFLVSGRFVEMWRDNDFHGIEAFDPVEIAKIRRNKAFKELPPRYYRVTIPYGGTAINLKSSRIIYKENKPLCPDCLTGPLVDAIEKLAVDELTWESQDIFRLRGSPGKFIATERFAMCCKEHKISNAEFLPIEEFSRDYRIILPDNPSGEAER